MIEEVPVGAREIAATEAGQTETPDFTVGSWVHIQVADGRVTDVHRTPDLSWHLVVDAIGAAFVQARAAEETLIAELYGIAERSIPARHPDAAPPERRRRGALRAAFRR